MLKIAKGTLDEVAQLVCVSYNKDWSAWIHTQTWRPVSRSGLRWVFYIFDSVLKITSFRFEYVSSGYMCNQISLLPEMELKDVLSLTMLQHAVYCS